MAIGNNLASGFSVTCLADDISAYGRFLFIYEVISSLKHYSLRILSTNNLFATIELAHCR